MRDKMRRARYAMLLATLATACAQQSQLTSLDGTWDFAFAADAAAADHLAGFYQDGFQGGGFRPIVVPSNWALKGSRNRSMRGRGGAARVSTCFAFKRPPI